MEGLLGKALYVDHFWNMISRIRATMVAPVWAVALREILGLQIAGLGGQLYLSARQES